MSTTTPAFDRELCAKIVPPAQAQTDLPSTDLLHSANAGVVVSKVGQVRSEFRSEARMFAREVAKHVNLRQAGEATAFVYEETFGTEDRLHFLIHLRSLDSYYSMVEMGDRDRAYRDSLQAERVETDGGAKAWDRLYVDGSMRSTVMLPASWAPPSAAPSAPARAHGADGLLHSGSAGIVIHRFGDVAYDQRGAGRRYARELVELVNGQLAGEVTALAYDEAFGTCERVHWLLHLRDLTAYSRILELDEQLPDAGEAFVQGSLQDVALTPHHWGLYGTNDH